MSATRHIAVALDTLDRESFFKPYEQLKDLDLVFKIGLKIFPRLELLDWKKFAGKKVFIDAKLHDIPSQVADAISAYGDLGANFITVHLSGGRKMLEEAQKKAERYGLTLLGVSALTSLSEKDLAEIGLGTSPAEVVKKLLTLGTDCGLKAFVMSPHELKLKKDFPGIYCVTPGISLVAGKVASDQSRSATLLEALSWGSDMPVIGRAILEATDPNIAAKSALKMLEQDSQK